MTIALTALLLIAPLDVPRVGAPAERPYTITVPSLERALVGQPAALPAPAARVAPGGSAPAMTPRVRAIAEAFELRAQRELGPTFPTECLADPRAETRLFFQSQPDARPRPIAGLDALSSSRPDALDPLELPGRDQGYPAGLGIWNSGLLEAGFDTYPELSRYGQTYTFKGTNIRVSVEPCWP